MPITRLRLAGPTLIGASPETIYTVSPGFRARIRTIDLFNGSDQAIDVTISIGADTASTRILDAEQIPARGKLKLKNYSLVADEFIQAFASVGGEVTITVNGTEYSVSVPEVVESVIGPTARPSLREAAFRVLGPGGFRKGARRMGGTVEPVEGGEEALSVWLGQTAGYAELATENGWGNVLLATPWFLESRYGDCTLTHLSIYCGTAVGNCRLHIYSDSSGQPGSLIAESSSFALSTGWNTQAIGSLPTLTAGTWYWLSLNPSSSSAFFGARPGTQEGLTTERRNFTFGAAPASWGTPDAGTFDWNICMYATLESQSIMQPTPTAPQSSPPTLTGGGSLSGYTLLFYDEFDYRDRLKWTNQVWWDGTEQPDCIYVDAGVLHLVAKEDDGYDLGGGNAFYTDGWPHVLIDTVGFKDDFREGYYEARMRSTGNRADFPAWWLFSTDWAKTSNCGAGDRAAELDVVELWGNQFPTVFSGTAHSDSANSCTANNQGPDDSFDDIGITTVGQWRTYGLLWEPTLLRWYVDNVLRHSLVIGPGTDWTTFDRDMHVILYQWPYRGVTIDGGTWPAPTTGVDPAEIHTEVDWVRVWEP